MRRNASQLALILAMFIWCDRPVQAWNSAGHRIISDITYDLLDDATRAKAVELIKSSPRFQFEFVDKMPANVKSESDAIKDRWCFLQSSIWADLVRGNAEWSIEKWHYINKPFFLTDLDEIALKNAKDIQQSTILPDKIASNVDPADLNAVQALRHCFERLASPTTSKEKKSTYLLWVMHVVGDLHQPLHSTSLYSRGRFQKPGGDRGGNSIKTKQSGNLHALWDGLLGGAGISLNEVRGRAQKLISDSKIKKLGEDSASGIDPAVWVDEGHVVCKEAVYCKQILDEVTNKEFNPKVALATLVMTEEYMTNGGRIARERAIQGAYRLAAVLKRYLE